VQDGGLEREHALLPGFWVRAAVDDSVEDLRGHQGS
jgi:hypothetical protein